MSAITHLALTWFLAAPPTCEVYRPAGHYTLTPEERRLQVFWRDYGDALRRYYGNVDWTDYYKKMGSSIESAPCPTCPSGSRIRFAPVFVSPSMQWGLPSMPAPLPRP
ncbi:MAG: hypothetical protein U0793_25030 [Gemmataceae bacterium]